MQRAKQNNAPRMMLHHMHMLLSGMAAIAI